MPLAAARRTARMVGTVSVVTGLLNGVRSVSGGHDCVEISR